MERRLRGLDRFAQNVYDVGLRLDARFQRVSRPRLTSWILDTDEKFYVCSLKRRMKIFDRQIAKWD